MIIKDRSFPHPILAPFRDDVQPNEFELSYSVIPDADNYYLDVEFKYENSTLKELVQDGRAVHAIHIECRRNFYRELRTFRNSSERVTIPATELVGRVEISGFIKAEKQLQSYTIEGSHEDYGNMAFNIQSGDLLAVGQSSWFDAFTDYDPLQSIASILTIRKSEDDNEGPMKVDTGDDRFIIATLSKQDYERYTSLKGNPTLGPLLANQVVVPALFEAVSEMKKTDEEELALDMDKKWFRSIRKKLTDFEIDIRSNDVSVSEAVQTILKLPLRRSLESLNKIDPIDE